MPAGLIVFGDGGQMQIDGSTPMITLRRTGTVQCTNQVTGGITANLWGNSPIALNGDEVVAFRPNGAWATMSTQMSTALNGGTFVSDTQNATIDYWVFGPHIDSGLNYGLRVMDSNGTLIYDTGRPMLNILGSHDGTGGPTAWGNSNVAVLPAQVFRRYLVGPPGQPGGGFYYQRTSGGVWVGGNQVSTGNKVVYTSGTITGTLNTFGGQVDNKFMVVGLDNLF